MYPPSSPSAGRDRRYGDQTQSRIDRAVGIPLGDGRVMRKSGLITSAGDAARSAATRATDAAHDARTGANPVPMGGGFVGDTARAADAARRDPRSNPNLRPTAPQDGQSQFVRQQLLAMSGTVPGRVYNPQTLGRATDAQVAGELAALEPRNEFVQSQIRGDQARVGMERDRQAMELARQEAGAGFASYDDAAASVPEGVTGDFVQEAKTGRWRVSGTKPTPPPEPPLGEVLDVGGTSYVRTNPSQITPLPRPEPPPKPSTETITVGGRELVVGPGNRYFDAATGEPVDFGGQDPVAAYFAARGGAGTPSPAPDRAPARAGRGRQPERAAAAPASPPAAAPARTRAPVRPAATTPVAAAQAPAARPARVQVRTPEDFAALAPGTPYITAAGQRGTKGRQAAAPAAPAQPRPTAGGPPPTVAAWLDAAGM